MSRNKVTVGLFGFGCVGEGLFDVLKKSNSLAVRQAGFVPTIKRICVKHKEKKRKLSEEYFTFNKKELLNDPDINVIVEATDDYEEAFEVTKEAMKKGKAVVTANKKMVAEYMEEILQLQEVFKVPFLYEAACCASIPIIRNFEEYYDNDFLQSFRGIMNGTTNYILTEVFGNGKKYQEALEAAKDNGFAESNPESDIEGFDSKYKLAILLTHAFGLTVRPDKIFNLGIQKINDFDVKIAKEKNAKIKLVARAEKLQDGSIAAFVIPEFIYENDELYIVDDVNNGIVTENYFADRNVFIGKGAGAFPTAAALLSDLSALSYEYKYEYKKKQVVEDSFLDNDFVVEAYVRYGNRDVTEDQFSEIYDRHYARDFNYITGRINFKKLISSEWINKQSVNVILNNNKID